MHDMMKNCFSGILLYSCAGVVQAHAEKLQARLRELQGYDRGKQGATWGVEVAKLQATTSSLARHKHLSPHFPSSAAAAAAVLIPGFSLGGNFVLCCRIRSALAADITAHP